MAETEKLSLEILKTICESQNANGLRHRDFLRYRQYCARRGRRIRQALGFKHGKKVFVRKEITSEIAKDSRHLLLLLVDAERAWSYAMQLKQDMEQEPSPRKVFHLRSRLAKAASWSERLRALCGGVADTKTCLEADGYSAWMHGNLYLERNELEKAMHYFLNAKSVYESLESIGSSDQKYLFSEKLSQIAPNLRYCQYLMGSEDNSSQGLVGMSVDNDALLKSKVEKVLEEARVKQAQALDHISWKGKEIPIKNENIRLCLLKADEEKRVVESLLGRNQVDDETETAFNEWVMCFDEAIQHVRKDLSVLETSYNRTKLSEEEERDLKELLELISGRQIFSVKCRNEFIAEIMTKRLNMKTSKQRKVRPDDLVSLYDKLMQNTSSLLEMQDFSQISKEQLDRDLVRFSGFRLFFRAESYARSNMWAESFALFSKAETLFQRSEDSESLLQCQRKKLLAHSNAILDQETGLEQSEQHSELSARLDQYCGNGPLALVPPGFATAPNKPVLFDLAWNQIQYPDLSERVQKKGIFGLSFW